MSEIQLILKILDIALTVIPAALDEYHQLDAIRDEIKARHAAGETMTTDDCRKAIEEIVAIDQNIQAELARRRALRN